jgi:hypothetical protein
VGEQLHDHLDSVLFRHVNVGDDEVTADVTPKTKSLDAITCLGDVVPRPTQENVKCPPDTRIVVHNHDPLSSERRHSVSRCMPVPQPDPQARESP